MEIRILINFDRNLYLPHRILSTALTCFLVSLALAHRFYPSLFFFFLFLFLSQTHLSFIAEYEYNQITKLPWLVDGGGESSNQIISSKSIEWATDMVVSSSDRATWLDFYFSYQLSFDYWPKCPFFSAKSSVTHYWPVFKALHLNGVSIPIHGLVQ